MKRGVVIGAGIAGLAVAIRLRNQGYEVDVFDKNSKPGGKIALVQKDGFRWDAGPSFFTDIAETESLFKSSGRELTQYLKIVPLDEACRYFYENGLMFHGYDKPALLAKEFNKLFGEPAENVREYLKSAALTYKNSSLFLNQPFSFRSLVKPSTLKHLKYISVDKLTKHLYTYNSEQFQTSEAADFFDRFSTYNGSNPLKMPAIFSCIPHLEHNLGAYYIDNGMHQLVNAVYKLAVEIGIQFHFDTAVSKITHRKKLVTGVISEKAWHEAEVVVSSADINWVYRKLIHPHPSVLKHLNRERSTSAIVFLWGINGKFKKLGLHNIFFSNDMKKQNSQIWQDKTIPTDPTVYINVTSKMNKNHAPNGKENWFVMINAPSCNNQKQWLPEARKLILEKISKTLGANIEPLIISETVIGPDDFAKKYHANNGSLYGAASNSIRGAFLRHPNQSPEFSNLYFCGVTVHPGGGIPLALRSSRIVSDLIRKKKW